MIILTGRNLGERQRELNAKVKEAAAKYSYEQFDKIKDTTEKSDVDKLFKIDLASEYLNIEYIIDVLKSGDSLYISRALKCSWMYGDRFSNIINADYLHNNVIPFMSTKMKKKLLTAISTHVRCETRAAEFYKYCMDIKYTSIALKFLNFTSDTFKLELLKDKSKCNHLFSESGSEYLKNFIGLSFTLAAAYVEILHETNRVQVFQGLSYLYSVSNVKYLDLLEKSVLLRPYNHIFLGLRISRSIMKHHKDRVLKNPSLYVRLLSKSAIVKYSTAEDAKIFAVALLPDNVEGFWNQNYCSKYKYIIDKIQVGKFEFVKDIFTAKYPEQQFEMHLKFYEEQCYKILMTAEEKETWALQQITSGAEILGIGKDYIWYKFVSFEKALEEIKKLVLVTTDNMKRADMMLILADSVKTQRDVEKLLKIYYERHGNEQKYNKENFIDRILENFNVFEFDEDCWTALNNMFYNMQVYNTTDYSSKSEFRIVALIHNIINQENVPEAIKIYINSEMQFYALKLNTDRLTKVQQEMVFHYLFEFYTNEVKKLEKYTYDEGVKYRLRKYIHFILDLLDQYGRTKQDLPEIVNNFMKRDWEEFEYHKLLRVPVKDQMTRFDLLRDLKKDAKLLVERLPLVKTNIDSSYEKYDITAVLKKLKIYFSQDIAKDYLNFFDALLKEDPLCHRVAQAASHGIFQLGDESLKSDIMTKYAPKEAVIKHNEIDQKLLRIQEAICSHAYYSRPPVPLKHMLMYIKGDYVHFCLPMFHSYLANLPLPLCMEFVEAILNTPVSIQKHALRLAFECFNAENLNTLVLRAWKKTKNVSIRMIIFKAIFNKISGVPSTQDILFDTFKTITSTLRQDDDDEVFSLLLSRQLPDHLLPECVEIAWKVVSQFPPKAANLNRMRSVIITMSNKINIIRQDTVHGIIDTFITSIFSQEGEEKGGNMKKPSPETTALIEAKWKLTAAYIINIQGKKDLDKKLELTKLILNKYLTPQETGIRNKHVLLKTCFSFIHDLERRSYFQDWHSFENVNIIMQFVLQTLQNKLSIEEIYMEEWELRLGTVARKVIADGKMKLEDQEQTDNTMRDSAINLGKELGYLIKEYIEKEMYFASFSAQIQTKIDVKTQTVKNILDARNKLTDIITFVCLGLMSFEITEMYLLVLNLLPASCSPEYEEDYKTIINMIHKLDNKEIRCNLFRKLANGEFEASALI